MHEVLFFFFSNDNSCSYDPAVDALFLHTFSEFPMHIDLNPDPCPWMNKTPIPEAGVFQAWSIYFARRGRHSVSDMSRGQIRKQNHLRLPNTISSDSPHLTSVFPQPDHMFPKTLVLFKFFFLKPFFKRRHGKKYCIICTFINTSTFNLYKLSKLSSLCYPTLLVYQVKFFTRSALGFFFFFFSSLM